MAWMARPSSAGRGMFGGAFQVFERFVQLTLIDVEIRKPRVHPR